MLPNFYSCTACGQRFDFAATSALYYIGGSSGPLACSVSDADLLVVPVRPAWCGDCGTVSIAEDIEPLRAFETAYGAVRAGGGVEYPIKTDWMSARESQVALEAYLRWRAERRHSPRVLCCGGTNYQHMDVATPLLKHQECEFGLIEAQHIVSSFNGPGPGVISAANIGLYSGEGDLIGRLTWRERASNVWAVVPDRYLQGDES